MALQAALLLVFAFPSIASAQISIPGFPSQISIPALPSQISIPAIPSGISIPSISVPTTVTWGGKTNSNPPATTTAPGGRYPSFCGYATGNPDLPVTCGPQSACFAIPLVKSGMFGCCPSTIDPSSNQFDNCDVKAECFDNAGKARELASCLADKEGCAVGKQNLFCTDSAAPQCATYTTEHQWDDWSPGNFQTLSRFYCATESTVVGVQDCATRDTGGGFKAPCAKAESPQTSPVHTHISDTTSAVRSMSTAGAEKGVVNMGMMAGLGFAVGGLMGL